MSPEKELALDSMSSFISSRPVSELYARIILFRTMMGMPFSFVRTCSSVDTPSAL